MRGLFPTLGQQLSKQPPNLRPNLLEALIFFSSNNSPFWRVTMTSTAEFLLTCDSAMPWMPGISASYSASYWGLRGKGVEDHMEGFMGQVWKWQTLRPSSFC